MKLAVLTNILTPYRIPLFEAIERRVEDLTILLMAEREENRDWKLGEHRLKTVVLPGMHIRPPGYAVSVHLNYGVGRALRVLGPDVVLNGGFGFSNLAAWRYCARRRARFVGWGELTPASGGLLRPVREGLRRWLTGWSDGSVASTSEARETFLRYGAAADRTITVVMPIDVEFFHRRAAAFRGTPAYLRTRDRYPRPILLSVGQLIDRKGYQELFRMYERVLAVRPTASLLIVGDGPERQRYERMVKAKSWPHVYFTGFLQADALPSWLAIADVFVFHTLFDPFGAVLSEAMAAGLPVASSIHAAATGDLVVDGVTGFRIDPRDTEASAASVVEVLALSQEARDEMGRAAYARVRRWTFDATAETMVAFMESLLKRDRAAGRRETGHAAIRA